MGPLTGVRVLELASAAPAPFACMLLSDLGAEVLRIDRPATGRRASDQALDPLVRGRRSLAMDLKSATAASVVARLADQADVLVEGFRPGVTERLGLGPQVLCARNQGLVYARMTGWGQDGPMASRAGHDINYIALAGALEPLGRAGERPHAPVNLLGDFGGGGMLLALGILAALHERTRSSRGQVVDAAMIDGAALLTAQLHGMRAQGVWDDRRGTNLLDGGAPFYDTYVTADGGYISVGALERRFYAQLLQGLGLADAGLPEQMDRTGWPRLRAAFASVFLRRTRREWMDVFADLDACVSPVWSLGEAPHDVHLAARGTFVSVDNRPQPAPAPRFSRTSAATPEPAPVPGAHSRAALRDWGFAEQEVAALLADGVVTAAPAVEVSA
ncbi:MAG: CaiB/BaiF CoA transferase family protein [Mycobacteriales bacterium]